ncbi:putative CoA-dependent acyltransferase [Legionella beliardensis]|uniref:Putative CoA-dependent acyltransferase n=1 Tax=Legionella beliardensis TaxID=91822 RepID=A0A378I5G0_9GAMM|nr:2-oxo acid dehydrogenase subunit E2 [Legionella beliardensis]STX29901.1 putative CoA-dependent acyltransferase [Legionella beliardensis]
MDELNELLRPTWGSEKWILEGWQQITASEKELIKSRVDKMFQDGLPFKVKQDKLLYIYAFSLLAQLEVLAIQVPLKFESKMLSAAHRKRMRLQLLDEIFHGIVFTKILYMLCAPYAYPPPYNPHIEIICNFIRSEECPKTAVVLLNLIGEGWIEEIFYSLERAGVAPKVFETIIEDEHRHVCEAVLYKSIGLPNIEEVKGKLAFLEEQLFTNLFMQHKYIFSLLALLNVHGSISFIESLSKKHREQVEKLNLKPSQNWQYYMQFMESLLPKIRAYNQKNQEIEMTPIRKVLMTQWDNPTDPTMAGQFNINISCVDFFGKKYPPETVTTLMLQAVSLILSENDSHRHYLSYKRLYRTQSAYAGLVVKLPDCGDQMSTIVFENCHLLTLQELSLKIRSALKMMVYCFKRREALEKSNPQVQELVENAAYEYVNDLYGFPVIGNPVVSVSNIGACGYTQCKSPLRRNEGMKYTLMEVERKLVWNKATKAFEEQDLLPVSISADHRVFDGNTPVPKMVADCFNRIFAKMVAEEAIPVKVEDRTQDAKLVALLDQLIEKNVEMGFKALSFLQTYWCDFLKLEDMLDADFLASRLMASELEC